MKIGFLGTGSGSSQGQRLNTSLTIESSKGILMIDCSGLPEYSLAKQKIKILKVNNLLFTHSHIDHLYALPSFIHTQRILSLPNNPPILKIFGLSETLITAKKLINSFQLLKKIPQIKIDFIPLIATGEFKVFDFIVEFFPVNHGTHPALGFLIKIPKEDFEILYSGDTGISKNILKRIRKNTILIHECCGLNDQKDHTSAYQLLGSLKDNMPTKLILVHLPYLALKDKKQIISLFKQYTSIKIPDDTKFITL